jgi:pyruvate dehydrogenase E1 component
VLSSTVPNCRAYDPAFAYEVAVLIQEGIERMYGAEPEDVFYYLTLYNENSTMPPMPEGSAEGIIRGLYRFAAAPKKLKHRAQLLASGTAMLAALEAQQLLADEFDVAADVWSATSYKLLREDALEAERWNRLHPGESPRVPYVTQCLGTADGVFVAASDYVKVLPDAIDRWLPRPLTSLGTDGFGRSENRTALRDFFEVDAKSIVIATLAAQAKDVEIDASVVAKAISDYGVNHERPNPAIS